MSQKYHPDKNPGCLDCDSKMNKLTWAYDVLSNPTSKSEFDKSSKILVSLRSLATPLNLKDYEEKLLKRNAPWLILVYDSN